MKKRSSILWVTLLLSCSALADTDLTSLQEDDGVLLSSSTYLVAPEQKAEITLRNSSPAFMDVVGFDAEEKHIASFTNGGTFGADKVRMHHIPMGVTHLKIHLNFQNGSETVHVRSSGGFDGKEVHCKRYNRFAPMRCYLR